MILETILYGRTDLIDGPPSIIMSQSPNQVLLSMKWVGVTNQAVGTSQDSLDKHVSDGIMEATWLNLGWIQLDNRTHLF